MHHTARMSAKATKGVLENASWAPFGLLTAVSQAFTVAFASISGHFCMQPSSLSLLQAVQLSQAFTVAFAGIHGRFRMHSGGRFRRQSGSFSQAAQLAFAFAFASSPACFRFLSQAAPVIFASSPARFRKQPHGRFRLQISSLSLSLAPTVAFASTHGCFRTSSPARFRFRKHSRSLLQAAQLV